MAATRERGRVKAEPVREADEALPAAPPARWGGVRFGLLAKITTFMFLILVPLAALTWWISVQSLRANLTDEFTSKGSAIARGLANSGVDLILTRDASTVQAQVDQVAGISGVAYVLVYDAQKTIIAHTFAPFVPPGLIDQNLVPGDWPQKVQEVAFKDPAGRGDRDVIDIAVPVLAGQLGTVRVGMDRAIITAAAAKAGRNLLLTFAGFAVAAALAGMVFAQRVTRPVKHLVRVAEQVGRGDLSKLAPVESRDEIGQLAVTFNDSIVRLRSLVQTVAERDAERKQRQDLQANISRFLDVATEVSKGDLTRRGEVTSDVLGSVVDSINVMVGEIATILVEVRQAAHHVSTSANEMIVSMGQIETGARAQARDAMQATGTAEQLGTSARGVASTADASARAARQGLDAAQHGEQAVRNSLESMQRIRSEVQGVSKKIKNLGDRSMEISEIVNTIDDIASQTNLLALNAAIEAAGAGEAGLRFAVVADEVRKLAERSAKATRDIATLIKNFQSETQQAVIAMEEGTREVEAGFRVTSQAGESLREIAAVSQKAAGLAQDISVSTQEQVKGAEHVGLAVQAIAGVALQTEQSVLQTRKTVDDLVRLAQELGNVLSRFKLAA
ncbi:MAG TPA: methyl-accepting chemotaxis protein [Methylomirabilota bacterium]|nr:methyl-accepting chemotaxis protein [Methylomirabilota bacterium]